MSDNENVKEFFGVYLLFCKNPKFVGRTYIGYTVNPSRRIKQHNGGRKAGGACRTSNRGPWEMVLIIHGFPNDISALRFEWAWQNPERSRRLKHVSNKKLKEKKFDFSLRVLSEMLRVGPWHLLPLTVRWLNQEYVREFPIGSGPPMHMPVAYGLVTVAKKISKKSKIVPEIEDIPIRKCCLCHTPVLPEQKIDCINPNCSLSCHIICLAKLFTSSKRILPVEGTCPKCALQVVWGDLIRKRKGCFDNLEPDNSLSDSE